jgi:hypothetical protein
MPSAFAASIRNENNERKAAAARQAAEEREERSALRTCDPNRDQTFTVLDLNEESALTAY